MGWRVASRLPGGVDACHGSPLLHKCGAPKRARTPRFFRLNILPPEKEANPQGWQVVVVQGWGNDRRKACFGFVHPGGVPDRTWALTATGMELDVKIPAVTEAEVALPVLRFSGLGVAWGSQSPPKQLACR